MKESLQSLESLELSPLETPLYFKGFDFNETTVTEDNRVSIETPRSTYESSPAFRRESSFWSRVSRTTPFPQDAIRRVKTRRSNNLQHEGITIGQKDIIFIVLWIACGWMFLASKCIYLIRDSSATIEIVYNASNSTTAPTLSPVDPFNESLWQGSGRDFIFHWVYVCCRALFTVPLTFTISVYVYTNLGLLFTGRKLAIRLMIIHFMHTATYMLKEMIATHYQLAHRDLYIILMIAALNFVLTMPEWYLLTRLMSLRWLVNVYWFPAILLCYTGVIMLALMPTIVTVMFLKEIVVYIPLLMMLLEYIICKLLKYSFYDNKYNHAGLTLTIAFLIYPMEVTRFVSFVLLWLERGNGAPLHDLVLNVIFSFMSEIYTHTQIYEMCKYEIQMRLHGDRREFFPKVYRYVCSIRSILEYAAPTFFVANVLLTNAVSDHIPSMSEEYDYIYGDANRTLMKSLWPALGAYYLLEIVSEVLCSAIRRLSSYKRESAIGDLNWTLLLVLIIFVGTAPYVPDGTVGFLRILTLNDNNMTFNSTTGEV